jgi:hypothetical protein
MARLAPLAVVLAALATLVAGVVRQSLTLAVVGALTLAIGALTVALVSLRGDAQ